MIYIYDNIYISNHIYLESLETAYGCFSAWRSESATVDTARPSRSEAATISITFTMTPMSMYIIVTEVMSTKSIVHGQKTSSLRALRRSFSDRSERPGATR